MNDCKQELLQVLEQLHTTPLGAARIRRNLHLAEQDVVGWCRQTIRQPGSTVTRQGKNWYVEADGCRITVNAGSRTIITAHPCKPQ